MTVYDWGKVSRETLEELASEAFVEEQRGGHLPPLRQAIAEAARQAAVPPLRARAEVHAEIAEIVREYVRDVGARDAFGSMERDRQKLLALVAEPLAPEIDPLHPTGRCSCAGEGECAWCIVACPGCSFRRCDCQCDPEACSCEESERLKARVAELEGELALELGISMGHQNQLTEVRRLLRALEHRLARIGEWADEHGSALVPRGADTYGEGVRACKAQAKALVSK